MGQLTSSEKPDTPHEESYTKEQLRAAFQIRAAGLLKKAEIASISAKVNMNELETSDAALTYTDLASLLGVLPENDTEREGNHVELRTEIINEELKLDPLIKVLYRSFTILGRLPFLASSDIAPEQLTIKKLLVALSIHSGRLVKIWRDMDYLKLVFYSLSKLPRETSAQLTNEKRKSPSAEPKDEKCKSEGASLNKLNSTSDLSDELVSVKVLNTQQEPQHDLETISRNVRWEAFVPLTGYDEVDMDSFTVSASDLSQLLTFFLMLSSIPDQSHLKMQEDLMKLAADKWATFETASIMFSRFIDVGITRENLSIVKINFSSFERGMKAAATDFLATNYKRFLKVSALSYFAKSAPPPNQTAKDLKSMKTFNPTRLVDEATISILALFMKSTNSSIQIASQNMVELYNGAQSGFSIRSLESKIFKWQAPTILLVSGKRLRNKTISKNKRYQQFDSEFPRYFRSTENPKKSWQSDTDKITYAVFLKQPWKNSNKNNFGDEETAILCLSPRYDFFTSKRGHINSGKSVYFNTQGMGIGFGNEQPVNKNQTRRHVPGSVSLTIEANLEFGVFRHTINASANTPRYFEKSQQETISDEDYEDRFMITDLEVWGVGSTKELDEQRKQWEWEEKQAQARQGVNLRDLGEERAFLEMAGLAGNHGAGGSI